MRTDEQYMARLRDVAERSTVIDGKRWYDAEAVCAALGMEYKAALRKTRPEHKLSYTDKRLGFRTYHKTYFDRGAIEGLIMLKGLPRRQMLGALDDA